MIYRKQLSHHDPDSGIIGDCFRTCIGCLLDLEPQDVPHWSQEFWDNSNLVPKVEQLAILEWLERQGYTLLQLPCMGENFKILAQQIEHISGNLLYIVSGTGTSGGEHVVIYKGSEMLWDPSPTGGGLTGPGIQGVYWLSFLLPSNMRYVP
jgi:hypothetical protein